MPTRGLTQWQVGTEVTWGTAVTATAKLMGVQDGSYLQADNRSNIYPDIRNSLQPGYLDGLEQIAGKGGIESLLTYEDAPYFLDNIAGQASPTGTGPYVRAYTAPTTAAPTPRILTCIYGNTQTGGGIYKLAGGLLTSLNIKGATGKPTMISGDLIGKNVSTGSFAALSDRTVEVVMGQPWLLYIDAAGGTIGSTAVATTAVAFDLALKVPRTLVWSLDALTPDTYEEQPWEGDLKLTLRMNATTKTEVDNLVGQTATIHKQIRLKATSGTKVCQLDFAGTVKAPPKTYDDADGVLTVEIGYSGRYNAALANFFAASITNSVEVLA